MNLKEQLAEKKSALLELEPQLKSEDVTEEVISQGEALASEIEELEAKIETAEKAASVLEKVGTAETTTNEGEKKMSKIDEFTELAKNMTDRKSGISMDFKAATDVVTAPQLADIDRSIAPQPTRTPVASFFSNATISGNAITYFRQGAFEGTPAVTAQGAKKPQVSTSFAGTTLALSKIAAFIKETDEILDDASFLASEVQNSLIYQLGKVEDATIIGAVAGTSGIGAATYDGTVKTLADGILDAILKVKADSAYDASVVLLNPADVYALLTAKDGSKQYYGGGYFTGAYGNGAFGLPTSIWGVQIFASSSVTQGSALVAAREAVKVWKKGGMAVKLYEQNEDDAIYNRVTLLAEERLACAVIDLKGVVLLSQTT
jgi:HK97 family phage major capsid protein